MRHQGIQITTNIATGVITNETIFSLINSANLKSEDHRLTEFTIVLSDWVFNAIKANEVLTLHRDYFRLRNPLERRVYELARKHCGGQRQWRIGLDTLRKKTGSTSPLKQFKYLVTDLIKHDHLSDMAANATQVLSFIKDKLADASPDTRI